MTSSFTTTTTSASNNSHSTTSSNVHNNNNNNAKSSSSSSSSSSRLSNSNQATVNSACAACKYQRRKCKADCSLAPFFPASNQQKFLNAHRLFGVSNINKIISKLDPYQRSQAMQTIIFQSDMRARYPVGGCYHLIRELEYQLEHDTAELECILRQLALYRAQAAAAAAAQPLSPPGGMSAMPPPDMDQVNPNLLLNTPAADDVGNAIYDGNLFPPAMNPNSSLSHHQHDQQQQLYHYFYDGSAEAAVSMSRDQNSNLSGDSNDMLSHQHCVVNDAGVKPTEMFWSRTLMGQVDDEGESKNNNGICHVGDHHGSTSLELKDEEDQREHMPEHDLKGAASMFTLTSLTNYGSSSL